MHVYLMRHGESQATLDPTIFGRMDPCQVKLTQWGKEQATEAGKALRRRYEERPELQGRRVVTHQSPYIRILQTAAAFKKGFGDDDRITLHANNQVIRERDHGAFDGLDREAQQALDPDTMAKLNSSDPKLQFETRMPGGGESLENVQQRMKNFYLSIIGHIKPDEDVVIISHGWNLRALEHFLTGTDPLAPGGFKPPRTGDIIDIDLSHGIPGTSEVIHRGKLRSVHMGKTYKTAPYTGGYDPSRQQYYSGHDL